MVIVTKHAIKRFRERVADLPEEQIIAALDSPAVRCAAAFGARAVKMASGNRIVLKEGHVVTVTPRSRMGVLGEG